MGHMAINIGLISPLDKMTSPSRIFFNILNLNTFFIMTTVSERKDPARMANHPQPDPDAAFSPFWTIRDGQKRVFWPFQTVKSLEIGIF
jgi:hypothetical protein